MNENNSVITIELLDKQYKFRCPQNQEHDLIVAAQYLNEKMQEIKQGWNPLGSGSTAIMAALNLSDELVKLKAQKNEHLNAMGKRIKKLQDKIEDNLCPNEQLEF